MLRSPHDSPTTKRVKHYDEPGHAHFLTFSCYQRMPLLSKDRTRVWLIDAITRAAKKHQFHVWACLDLVQRQRLAWQSCATDHVAKGGIADVWSHRIDCME